MSLLMIQRWFFTFVMKNYISQKVLTGADSDKACVIESIDFDRFYNKTGILFKIITTRAISLQSINDTKILGSGLINVE